MPGWYWWFLALGWVAVGAAVEFGGVVGAILALVVFGAVHAGPLAGAERPLPDRQPERAQDVAGHQVLFAVIAYVVVLCVVTLVVALAANADGAATRACSPASWWRCWCWPGVPGSWRPCAAGGRGPAA